MTLNFKGACQTLFVEMSGFIGFLFFGFNSRLFLKSKPATVPLQYPHQAALRSELD